MHKGRRFPFQLFCVFTSPLSFSLSLVRISRSVGWAFLSCPLPLLFCAHKTQTHTLRHSNTPHQNKCTTRPGRGGRPPTNTQMATGARVSHTDTDTLSLTHHYVRGFCAMIFRTALEVNFARARHTHTNTHTERNTPRVEKRPRPLPP